MARHTGQRHTTGRLNILAEEYSKVLNTESPNARIDRICGMRKRYNTAASFGFAFIVLGLVCCVNLSPKYGLVTLHDPENAELYFKREVRGLNYDVVVLSTNKQYCDEPDSKSEFVFASDPLPMYYRFEGNTLNLFLTSVVSQPPNFQSSIKVVQHHLSPSEFGDIKKHFKEKGLEQLDIPIDERLRCR